MESPDHASYEFGPFALDARERWLKRHGQAIALTPRAFDTLLLLVQNSGHLVTREQMMAGVWGGAFVEEGNLTVTISMLRKALGDGAGEAAYIETVPKLGYRFVPPVRATAAPPGTLVVEKHTRTRIVAEEEEIEEGAATQPAFLSGRALATVAAGALVLAAAVIGWRFADRPSAAPSALRVVPFASLPGEMHMPSFAPDGERVAFEWTGPSGSNMDIYVKTIGSDPPLRLTADEAHEQCPTWSPDGRHIAFLRLKGESVGIFVVGSLGGAERKLADVAYSRYYDLEWSPDGRSIAFAEKNDPRQPYDSLRSLAIFLLTVDSGEKRQLTFPRDPDRDHRFAFSPDGRALAFVRQNDEDAGLWRVPVDGGQPSLIHSEKSWLGHFAWAADGQSLIFTSRREGGSRLFRVPAAGGAPEPLPLAEDAAYYPAVSARGHRLAYVREYSDSDLWRLDLQTPRGPSKNSAALPGTARGETAPEFSPDGTRIAYLSEGTGKTELWISRADGTGAVALTDFHASTTNAPSWSPDGRQLVFASVHGPGGSPGGVFVLHLETRATRRLTDNAYAWPWWSRDGRFVYLAYGTWRDKKGIWKVEAAGGAPRQITATPAFRAEESFDGRTLYFSRPGAGIWKMPVGGGPETPVLPDLRDDMSSYWRVAATGIYYLNSRSAHGPAIELFNFATGRSHIVARLSGEAHVFQGGLTVSTAGKAVIYTQVARTGQDIMLVENFR